MEVDCANRCVICPEEQLFKINFSQVHGVCHLHYQELQCPSTISCCHCRCQVKILFRDDLVFQRCQDCEQQLRFPAPGQTICERCLCSLSRCNSGKVLSERILKQITLHLKLQVPVQQLQDSFAQLLQLKPPDLRICVEVEKPQYDEVAIKLCRFCKTLTVWEQTGQATLACKQCNSPVCRFCWAEANHSCT